MSEDSFETLCAIREALIALGLTKLLAALEDGDEETAEEALEALCGSPA